MSTLNRDHKDDVFWKIINIFQRKTLIVRGILYVLLNVSTALCLNKFTIDIVRNEHKTDKKLKRKINKMDQKT